jgi:ribulose 1,5-bisphosphate carboxylase large subunit-like protein
LELISGEDTQYIAYIAYPMDLLAETLSRTNPLHKRTDRHPHSSVQSILPQLMSTWIRPVPSLRQALKSWTLGARRLCLRVARDSVYEYLRGGLDFTKDDENVNSQPFMRWRDRFPFVGEATYKVQAETGEVKGHYLNATAGTCVQQDRSRGVFFTQDWAALPAVMPVASGGIHIWHMPALVDIFGDDACLQFGGGTLGHPWGMLQVPLRIE